MDTGARGLCQHMETYDVRHFLPIKGDTLVASTMYHPSLGKFAFSFRHPHHDECTCSLLYECIIHEIILRVQLIFDASLSFQVCANLWSNRFPDTGRSGGSVLFGSGCLVSLAVNRCQYRARDRASHCSNSIVSSLLSFWAMGTLISFLVHPFSTVKRFRDQYDQEGSIGDLIYHVTLFFAFGIYFVMRRHLNARSRAKHFRVEPPPVCLSLLGLFARVTLFDLFRKQIRPGQMRKRFKTPPPSPIDMIQTSCRLPKNSLVVTILPVLIQLQVFTWARFLRTTLMKLKQKSTALRLLRLYGETAHSLIENASFAASRNGSLRTRKCVQGLPAETRERRVRYASSWFGRVAYRTHSHRCRFGRSFDDVFEDGLATAPWREVLTPRDALISAHPGLQEVRGSLRASWCGCGHSLVELPYDLDLPAFVYLLTSFSFAQCLVSHSGSPLFWQCHCH